MKVFVTGGSGFLGKQLLLRLREGNYKVSALASCKSCGVGG